MLVQEQEAVLAELANHPALLEDCVDAGSSPSSSKLPKLTSFQLHWLRQRRGAELVIGPYILLDKLGEGGMGEVYKARHAKLKRIVAIKLIRTDKLNTRTAGKRFLREVQATARLDHPRIVRAIDADLHHDRHYLVMEYVEGIDFARLIAAQGTLPIDQAIDATFQVASALQSLKEAGVVHRDLKPTNLMRETSTGLVKLLDLGLSRVILEVEAEQCQTALTMSGSVIGTPDFMSPEQVQNPTNVDIRADIYSLGCILYFFLTGELPYPGGTPVKKMTRQLSEPLPDVRQFRPETPDSLVSILNRMTQKNRDHRYQSPNELIADLIRLQNEPIVYKDRPFAALSSEILLTRESVIVPLAEAAVSQDATDWANISQNAEVEAEPVAPVSANPGSGWRWWIVSGLFVSVLLLIGLFFFLSAETRSEPTLPMATQITRLIQDAPDELKELRERVVRARPEQYAALRSDLIRTGEEAFGTPRAAQVFGLLKRLPPAFPDLPKPSKEEDPAIVMGQTFWHHSQPIQMLSASQDGDLVAFVDDSVQVTLRSLSQKWFRKEFRGHTSRVQRVKLSPDGSLLLACSRFRSLEQTEAFEGTLCLWDVSTGKILLKINSDHEGWTLSGDFSPDGRYLLSGHFDSAKLWDLHTRKVVKTFHTEGMDWVYVLGFSPDGKKIFTGGNYSKQFRIWDRESGQLLHTLDGHSGAARGLAIHPNESLLATLAHDSEIRVWNTKTGRLLQNIPDTQGEPVALTWSVDGNHLVIGTKKSHLLAYKRNDWTLDWEQYETDGNPVTLQSIPKTGQLLIGTDAGRFKLRNPANGEEVSAQPFSGGVRFVAFDRNHQSVLGYSRQNQFGRFHLNTRKLATQELPNLTVHAIRPDGLRAYGRGEHWRPLEWHVDTRDKPGSFDWHGWGQLNWNGRRLLWVHSEQKSVVRLSDMSSHQDLHTFTAPNKGDWSNLAISWDGKLGATQSGETISVWNLETGSLIRSEKLANADNCTMQFTPDNCRLFIAGPSNRVAILPLVVVARNPITYGRMQIQEDLPGTIEAMAFSFDSEWVAYALKSKEIVVRPVAGGLSRVSRYSSKLPIQSLAFSIDGRLIAAGLANSTVSIYRFGW